MSEKARSVERGLRFYRDINIAAAGLEVAMGIAVPEIQTAMFALAAFNIASAGIAEVVRRGMRVKNY
jgi:hypothetical protein